MLPRLVVFLLTIASVFSSQTVFSTRDTLQRFAREAASVSSLGRGGGPRIRTSFYKALGDIERTIIYAEENIKRSSVVSRRQSVVDLRKAIVAAAKKGNYKIGREIFAITRVLEDQASLSKSRRRHKRASDDIINYIKEKIGDQTFNQFFNIESGTSLTFVLDTTGSMKEDIMQVQEIVKQLASPGEDEDGSGFHTFLLAPFKDPEVGPIESFYDKGEFLSSLERITVSGGGDCDEMVMNGINEGLLETEAYSPVFVFTDAGSKDIEERDTVLSLSKDLFSPIFFFITPSQECHSYSDFSPYDDLADETSGQVLSVSKSEIYKLQNFVKSTGVGRSEITSGDESTEDSGTEKRSTGQTHVREFFVDDTVHNLVVTVNFKTPTGSSYLLSPTQSLVHPTFVSAITNMRLYEIDDPPPGQWTLKAITDHGDEFTYKANTVSPTNIDFNYNLITESRGRDVLTNHAIPGELMKLQVDVVGAEETIEKGSSLVFLIDTSGNVISTVQTLQLSSGESHSYDGQFVVPFQTFRVVLYGETKTGYPFTRSSQNTITPSYGRLESFHRKNMLVSKVLAPGRRGELYFKFTNFSETTIHFLMSFTNPGSIITTNAPVRLRNVRKTKSKLIRLHYSIPGSVPDGTEFRITLMVEGGNVKSTCVYTVLVATLSG